MFIANVDVGYDARAILEKLDVDEYQSIRKALPTLKLPEDQENLKSWYSYTNKIVTEDDIAILTEKDIPVTIKRLRGLKYGVDRWGERGPQGAVNYNISVAGVGLMQVQTVDYMEDACTDALQDRLNEGWRILAVCPPNDTRRPTYILGHTERKEQ